LIRPERAQLRGEDAYRFRHLLIRDAAYDALPKATRAELHERFARWIELHGSELVELDEILGYHLEQACLYRGELGLGVDEELRGDARRRLTDAGRRAMARQDFAAAAHLVQRALGLVPEDEFDVRLEIDLADALFFSGRPQETYDSLSAAAERAAALGDRVGELCARLEAGIFKLYIEPEGATAVLEEIVAEALPELETAGDHFALNAVHFARAQLAHYRSLFDDEAADLDRAMYHAQRTGLPHLVAWFVPAGGGARFYGTTPLPEIVAWLDRREAEFGPDWRFTGFRASVLTLLGSFDEARRLESEYHRAHEERGDTLNLGSRLSQNAVVLELLAGDPATAASLAERGCRLLEEAGERAWLSTGACWYAEALYALGRLDEAEEWARKGEELGGADDASTQVLARQVRAKLLVRRGESAAGESHAREAVALADATQGLLMQADAYRNLGEVLGLAGRRDEAAAALQGALERYEQKGALAPAAGVRERLAALEPG